MVCFQLVQVALENVAACSSISWHTNGTRVAQISLPEDVFVDNDGNIYVPDNFNSIQKWLVDAKSSIIVAGGSSGSSMNQLKNPVGIFVRNNNMYIIDNGNFRVQKWTNGATSGITVAGGNSKGAELNQLSNCYGIYVDDKENVYISDRDNNRVMLWTPGATKGIIVAGGNGEGSNSNQLRFPLGIDLDEDGNIYIADYYNNRVQKWITDAKAGITVAGGNGGGSDPNQLSLPRAVSVDIKKNVYVLDTFNNRIQKWSPGASSGITIIGNDGPGSRPNQLKSPFGMRFDSNGNIFVADTYNYRIQKFTCGKYYRWPNGTFSLVPNGGLTVYYIARTGIDGGSQHANPNWQPFPKGLRMIAGNPMRRNFNQSIIEHHAISLTDFGMPSAPETNGFQTDRYFCKNGFRMQVFFPMCWNNKTLDSPDHRSHMAYPSHYNGGDCPTSHPVRLPGVFYEAFYSVDQFPHGQGTQPFVLSNGDPTGYGFHGDFVNGWDTDVLKAVIVDDSCNADNTYHGNRPERCLPLKPFVKARVDNDCELARPIPLTENIGMIKPLDRLPGCNPITYSNAVTCSQGAEPSSMNNEGTFHIQSKVTGGYLTFDSATERVFANSSTINPTYRQVWGLGWAPRIQGRTVRNSEINKHFTMQDTLKVKGVVIDAWEIFSIEKQIDSEYVTIKNFRHGKYLKVEEDFTISGQATTITDACLFKLVTPNGGFVSEGIKLTDLQQFL
ncbi:unnamed protein product [Rotaria sp. Silwood2]|nr:unnamed protein product [Rotaria sp. Silwood2]CAF4021385.1 unnamed protein product [Rotaria sp. Silwood2]